MKKATLIIGLLTIVPFFGQNLSRGVVADNALPTTDFRTFQFGTGLITQLQSGTFGDFTNSTWASLGSLNTGSQTVYGLRFQLPNKALTFGYQDTNSINPRVQWVGSGASLGNLEFRSADSFSSTTSSLIATMNSNGTTVFGNNRPEINSPFQRIGIDYSYGYAVHALNESDSSLKLGYYVKNRNGGSTASIGFLAKIERDLTASYGGSYTGVQAVTTNGNINYGVYGSASGGTSSYGVYGQAPTTNNNYYAGYFDGKVYAGSLVLSSDEKLKNDVKEDDGMLDRIKKLRAVNYNYNSLKELNLPKERQHGFIAQELEKIFPELVTTIKQPLIDENEEGKENKELKMYEFKAVNYIGLISVLTESLKELDQKYETELASLRQEIENLKNQQKDSKPTSVNNVEEFEMSQNAPNPFDNESKISYKLPHNQPTASIGVFDLNGKLLKEYKLNNQRGEVIIRSSEIGKGMFLYVLMNNNTPIISKKMIVK